MSIPLPSPVGCSTGPGHRVAITGLGAVTAIGCHPGAFWRNLLAATVGIDDVRLPGLAADSTWSVYPVQETDLSWEGRDREPVRWGRATQLAVSATERALNDAKLDPTLLEPLTGGVAIGSGHGNTSVFEERLLGRTDTDVDDGFQGIADVVASRWKLWGPSFVVATACSSGLAAIIAAAERIRAGEAEVMLAGGTEALSPSLIVFFGRLFMRGPDLCRPFDRHRKGMVVGEGAAMVVLESEAHARRRGARILAWLLGGAVNCDARDVTGMRADRVAECLTQAIQDAGLVPEAIDHISAHGSGTRMNDVNEIAAIKSAYGSHARRLAISGIKSMIGHTSGASGPIALVGAVLSLAHGVVPPTANLQTPDPDCDLDVVANHARSMFPRAAQVNAFGFGGSNASVVASAPVPGGVSA